MGYILVVKMGINCKLSTNDQQIKMYILIVYIIHVKYVDIIMSHHLELNIECDFIYVINEFLITYVDCNLFVIVN